MLPVLYTERCLTGLNIVLDSSTINARANIVTIGDRLTEAETRGQRFYMVRLALGDGARKPESLRAFSERIFRETGVRIHPSELSEIETDKPSKTVSADHIAAVAAVDPKKRGKLWLGWGEQSQEQRTPIASYIIPDSIANAVSGDSPAPAQPKPAERPPAKSATRKR